MPRPVAIAKGRSGTESGLRFFPSAVAFESRNEDSDEDAPQGDLYDRSRADRDRTRVRLLEKERRQLTLSPSRSAQILEVKTKISTQQGYPVALQKIIYSGQSGTPDSIDRISQLTRCTPGKILGDDKTVAEAGIKEGKEFCVVMVSKVRSTVQTA